MLLFKRMSLFTFLKTYIKNNIGLERFLIKKLCSKYNLFHYYII